MLRPALTHLAYAADGSPRPPAARHYLCAPPRAVLLLAAAPLLRRRTGLRRMLQPCSVPPCAAAPLQAAAYVRYLLLPSRHCHCCCFPAAARLLAPGRASALHRLRHPPLAPSPARVVPRMRALCPAAHRRGPAVRWPECCRANL